MNCPKCNNEMRIAHACTEARREEGGLAVYSVADLQCCDDHCPDGRRGVPTARVARKIERPAGVPGAVVCCGAPLAYVGAAAYWVPDGVRASADGAGQRLTVVCPSCGAVHTADIAGRTRAE